MWRQRYKLQAINFEKQGTISARKMAKFLGLAETNKDIISLTLRPDQSAPQSCHIQSRYWRVLLASYRKPWYHFTNFSDLESEWERPYHGAGYGSNIVSIASVRMYQCLFYTHTAPKLKTFSYNRAQNLYWRGPQNIQRSNWHN